MMEAQAQSRGLLFRSLLHQASVLGYLDSFFYSGIAALIVLPLALLLKGGVSSRELVHHD
jgi:hypothetical protein